MRILVVEDDRLLNNTLCYNLYTAGYVVDSVLTKSAASNFLTKQDYDLIVLDVNLPDGNGFDFCREVKERRPDTAVIFLTANDMESDMLKGYELGAEDYVTKPFPMSVFQKKLSVVLGRLAKQSGGGDSYEDGALSINFSEMTACLEFIMNRDTINWILKKLNTGGRTWSIYQRKSIKTASATRWWETTTSPI